MFKITITTIIICGLNTFAIAQPLGVKPPKETPISEKKIIAEVGEKAPAFSLKDQYGKTHTLAEYEGKVVVLEWFNQTCPFCKNIWESGLVSKLLTDLEAADTDVVYLSINSTANLPEKDVLKGGKEFIEELELEVPMLMDYDGAVGHLYNAKTTPHMFVIDEKGVLVYQGALSDDPRGKEGADADTHIMRVLGQLEGDKEVSPNYVQPWGCSVKYARKGDKSGRRRGPIGRPNPQR